MYYRASNYQWRVNMKFYILFLITALITLGCDTQPKEIMIASKPSQASVKLDQADVGITPLTIKIQKKITIEVSKPGYKPYTTVLSTADDPNLIITLERDELAQVDSSMMYPLTEDQIPAIKNNEQFQANQLAASNDQVNQLAGPNDQALVQNPPLGQAKEILIASKPSEATVRLNQAKIGLTPLKVVVQKDATIEVSKPGYQSYVNILSSTDEPNLIVTLEKSQSVARPARPAKPRLNINKTRSRLTITELKHRYRQGRINKLDYSAQVRKLKHQLKYDLADLKMHYKRGGIDKYEYQRRAKQIKYRYEG